MPLSHESRASEAVALPPGRHEAHRLETWPEPTRLESLRRDGQRHEPDGPSVPGTVVPLPLSRLPDALVPPNDLAAFERRVGTLAMHPSVATRRLGWVAGWPLHAVRLSARGTPRLRVVVTAGVHGIEPAGPAAVLLFLEQFLATPLRHEGVEVTALPLVNPVGYHARTRGNAERIDLNRSFGTGSGAPREVELVRAGLAGERFDLGIDLHSSRSSGERGWFALHRGSLELLAPAMRRFGQSFPILCEGTDRYVLESPGVLRSSNQGTLKDFLADQGARWAVTIEAPAAMPYRTQVLGSAEVVHALVETAVALI